MLARPSVELSLSALSAFEIEAHYATQDGTAVAGDDYVAVSGVALIPPMTPATEVTIPILDDADDEPEEVFTLELWDPVNAGAGDARGDRHDHSTTTCRDCPSPTASSPATPRPGRSPCRRAKPPSDQTVKSQKSKVVGAGVGGERPRGGGAEGQRSRGEWVREWVRLRPRPAP